MPTPRRSSATTAGPTVDQHFVGRAPVVRKIYDRLVSTARTFGSVREDPKKTSIHLARRSAFAGVATRKDAIVLTLRLATDVQHPRIIRREQASANRWHVELRLDDPRQVDGELAGWLGQAAELSE